MAATKKGGRVAKKPVEAVEAEQLRRDVAAAMDGRLTLEEYLARFKAVEDSVRAQRASVYNRHEALDPTVGDEVAEALAPAIRRLVQLADRRGVRVREVLWVATDTLHTEFSREILKRALESSATCAACGGDQDVTFEPDPYAQDVRGDETPVHMCAGCRDTAAQDI